MSTRRDRSCCCDSSPGGGGTADCCYLHGEQSSNECTESLSLLIYLAGTDYGIGHSVTTCRRCSWAFTVNKTVIPLVRDDRPSICRSAGYVPAGTYTGSDVGLECAYEPRVYRVTGSVTPRVSDQYVQDCDITGCPQPQSCECCLDEQGGCPRGGDCVTSTVISLVQPRLSCTTTGGPGTCIGKRFRVFVKAYAGMCQNGQGCDASNCPSQSCGPGWFGISGGTGCPSTTVCRCNNTCSSDCQTMNRYIRDVNWSFQSEIMDEDACPTDVTKWTLTASDTDEAYGFCNVY